jgi:lipopolysaccharide export system protein LptA
MKIKTLTQLLLVLIIIIISIFFFKTYFTNTEIKNVTTKEVTSTDVSKNNLIYKLRYSSKDKNENFYIITSEIGEVSEDEPELVIMKGVKATIGTKKSNPIVIKADNAIYNNINHNTFFYENVFSNFNQHNLYSDKLDITFEKNLLEIYENVVYKNLDTKLTADKIEVNLITKNVKIYMKNASDVVKIEK